jgi:all-trans-8'-apo-beta-carotenal 15,15'-oxygenase
MAWRKLPLPARAWPSLEQHPDFYAGLVTTLETEHDYECEVEGELPPVDGTLYRIGPGRYDRGPDRKRMLLDGDGMVQALTLEGGRARFRNRYVRTAKLVAEETAGRFIYPTFSTHGSGPLRHNLGLTLANQANTPVIEWAGRVWAFHESQIPYELTSALDTLGEHPPDPTQPRLRYWAHWKLDATRGVLHLLAIEQGPRSVAHVVTLSASGQIVARHRLPLPRAVYFHDWFVTERHFAFLLHPAYISPAKLLQVLVARETFSEAVAWRPDKGSVLHVVPRDGSEALDIETPACWMWHAINAHDEGDGLICDFVGSDIGGNLGDDGSVLFQLMRGGTVSLPAEPFNTLRRYRVDLARRAVHAEVLDDSANFELPVVSATERGLPHTMAYMIQADPGEVFARSLCQLDARTGLRRAHRFAEGEVCSEPVMLDAIGGPRGTHLATQIYDSRTRCSHFAIFDESRFEQGPVALVRLTHHVPLSFHGYWRAR